MNSYSIEVQLGERRYPVKVHSAEEEEAVRHAERLLNRQYHELQLRIAGQEPVDYMAMSSLLLLSELMRENVLATRTFATAVERIDRLLQVCASVQVANNPLNK